VEQLKRKIESWGVAVDLKNGVLSISKPDGGDLTQRIEQLIETRTEARARKDWAESDRIRDELAAMGIAIKDSKNGTTWEVAR
jgi:cysteinyl-tRNA synthetase